MLYELFVHWNDHCRTLMYLMNIHLCTMYDMCFALIWIAELQCYIWLVQPGFMAVLLSFLRTEMGNFWEISIP